MPAGQMNRDGNAAITGYAHPAYALALSQYGEPRELRRSAGWVLERPIPGSSHRDAMGCYPLFCCRDWRQLGDDLDELRGKVVSLSLVADPFGNHTADSLGRLFDRVVPYKEHFVADLSLPLEEFTSARHRKYGRQALQRISVEVCSNPAAHLDEWVRLYDHLIERHRITGMQRFSRESFARQLSVPGLVMFRATEGEELICLDLWYVQGEVAYGHLIGISPRGYEIRASYGSKLFVLEYFRGKVRWLDLGAAPGVRADSDDGLANFKHGWSSGVRLAYFCGRILDPEAYAAILSEQGRASADYFPAYRAGEFK